MKTDYKHLFTQLNYTFKNIALLKVALTHRSYSKDHNERFEFLGDAILSLAITDILYHHFPEATEGELSHLRSYLVRGETLVEIASKLNLGDYLLLGTGELKTGGDKRASNLANAMEAVIAAIYLDASFDLSKKIIFGLFAEKLASKNLLKKTKDPKSALQEYLQSKHLPLPEYALEKIEGRDHAQTFYVRCVVNSLKQVAHGSGLSRRRAEQNAAENFIKVLNNE